MGQERSVFVKNQLLEGKVEDLTSEGLGVVKREGFPFFVEGVIPGETIEFKVINVKNNFGYGRLTQLLNESPDRVEVKDDLGRQVGTMTLQHIAYPKQLELKQKIVQDAFERIGHFQGLEVLPTLGMNHPWAYRNKAQIPVRTVNGELSTGFYRKNSHDLIPVENFHIQEEAIDQAIITIRDLLRKFEVPAYNEEHHTGIIRHIIVKRGHYTGQMMVVLVTNGKKHKVMHEVAQAIHQALPEVVSIVQNVQTKQTNVILGRENILLWGQDYYEDQMLGKTFRISANSFFQVNTSQAEKLYQEAINAAQLTGNELVLDAYSGIGSITLSLAPHAKEVYAMEIVEEAVKMARENAQLNKIDNVTFEAGSAEEWIGKWNDTGIHFDVVVVDPPRKGLDKAFIDTVLEQAPQRIVYVSCNPSTLARDVRLIVDGGNYHIDHIQPVDLFCQTAHVECVVLMSRTGE